MSLGNDLRSTPTPDPPRHRSRKNRKRWCKGREGVEHDYGPPMSYWEAKSVTPQNMNFVNQISNSIQIRICRECGKLEWGGK